LDDCLERAELHRRLGQWPECVALCRQILDRDAHCAHALFIVGVAAQLEGRLSDARLYYEDAIRALPNHFDAHVALQNLEAEELPERPQH
jgi:hypothetical protein